MAYVVVELNYVRRSTNTSWHPLATNEESDGTRSLQSAAASGRLFPQAPVRSHITLGTS